MIIIEFMIINSNGIIIKESKMNFSYENMGNGFLR